MFYKWYKTKDKNADLVLLKIAIIIGPVLISSGLTRVSLTLKPDYTFSAEMRWCYDHPKTIMVPFQGTGEGWVQVADDTTNYFCRLNKAEEEMGR